MTALLAELVKAAGSKLQLYIDAAAVIAIVCASIWFVHHERAIGAQQVKDADARVVAAQTIHVQEVQSRAQTLVDEAVDAYKAAHPPANPVHVRVCHTPRGGTVSGGTTLGPVAPSASYLPAAVGQEGDDIGPFTDQLLEQADAEITALQAYVRAVQGMSSARPK